MLYYIILKGRIDIIETIYKILNNLNNKFYIGSTSNFNKRMKQHLNNCNNDKYKDFYKKCPKLYEDILEYGIENFKLIKIYESNNKIEISRFESKLIRNNIGNELMYNNVLGASGRRVLSFEDVYFIRDLYKQKKLYIKEAYEIYYKDLITFRAFKKAWHGETFKNIHYDVYTTENKQFHFSKGQSRKGEINGKSVFSEKDVVNIRSRRDNGENKISVWEDYKKLNVSRNSFYDIWNNKSWKYLI